VFNDLRGDVVVRFVDIGGIIDHHSKVSFHILSRFTRYNLYSCLHRVATVLIVHGVVNRNGQ